MRWIDVLCATLGAAGSAIAVQFGGWDTALQTLVIFIAIDYIMGLMVAGVFKRSKKTENGALESRAGFKGLCRKCVILFFVLIGHQLDLVAGSNFIRDAICIGYIVNETVSITENAGLMGVPIPEVITNGIEILKKKVDLFESTEGEGKKNE